MLNMSLVNYCLVDSHLCEYGLLFLLCCNLCGHALCKSEAGWPGWGPLSCPGFAAAPHLLHQLSESIMGWACWKIGLGPRGLVPQGHFHAGVKSWGGQYDQITCLFFQGDSCLDWQSDMKSWGSEYDQITWLFFFRETAAWTESQTWNLEVVNMTKSLDCFFRETAVWTESQTRNREAVNMTKSLVFQGDSCLDWELDMKSWGGEFDWISSYFSER